MTHEQTITFCPRCQTQLIRAAHSGDFVHTCQGTEVLRNEDILVIGDWEDHTGSNVNVHPNVLNTPQENRLQGTRGGFEGGKEPGRRTRRGFPVTRFRTRQHLHYLEEEFFKKKGVKRIDMPQEFIDV